MWRKSLDIYSLRVNVFNSNLCFWGRSLGQHILECVLAAKGSSTVVELLTKKSDFLSLKDNCCCIAQACLSVSPHAFSAVHHTSVNIRRLFTMGPSTIRVAS